MGKRNIADLKRDHAIFGRMVVTQQSTREIKEFEMFRDGGELDSLSETTIENRLPISAVDKRDNLRRTKSCHANRRSSCGFPTDARNDRSKNDHSRRFFWTRSSSHESPSISLNILPELCGDSNYVIPKIKPSESRANNFGSRNVTSGRFHPSSSDESNSSIRVNKHLLPERRKTFHGRPNSESSIEEEVDESCSRRKSTTDLIESTASTRSVSQMVDELLVEIYGRRGDGRRSFSVTSSAQESDCCSTSGVSSSGWRKWGYQTLRNSSDRELMRSRLKTKDLCELTTMAITLRMDVQHVGAKLIKELKRREKSITRRDKNYNVITAFLQAHSEKRSQDTKMRFSVTPFPGDSGFTQWHDAMKMVARLPGGIPSEFRKRLWLTLAEKHLQGRNVDWNKVEHFCFNEWSNPDDDELGVQIVKDLHRTGCSLFCGAEAEENQALLKRVLLAYARWNKAVGYCQGFNMLAALILQVMDRSESDSVKVMIYLIEGVLPESYFANNLRGLSVDMAVFRDLLRLRLPTLSRHLEQLQHDAGDSATGTSYEPPLTNVFTMQWFLTLFSNCLPQVTVLRVWDLIFLEGNEVLLRTALAIWDVLADKIMAVTSADEFYSIMGVLTREMLEFGLMDTNKLVKTIVTIAPFPFPELPELRDKYLYNITPWTQQVSTAARRGLRLFYSDDDDETDEDDEKIAVAAAFGITSVFRSPRRRDSVNRAPSPTTSLSVYPPDRDRLTLDISALKHQYAKLRERQRQAHIILTAACARQPLGPSAPTPVAMNHLLLGKNALLSVRGRRVGPPQGAVPPPANMALRPAPRTSRGKVSVVNSKGQPTLANKIVKPQKLGVGEKSGETLHWKDATSVKNLRRGSKDVQFSESVVNVDVIQDNNRQIPLITTSDASEVSPKTGISEFFHDEPVKKEKEHDEDNGSDSSSTSTELCDEPDRLSDFDSEEPTSDASSYFAPADNALRVNSSATDSSPDLLSPSSAFRDNSGKTSDDYSGEVFASSPPSSSATTPSPSTESRSDGDWPSKEELKNISASTTENTVQSVINIPASNESSTLHISSDEKSITLSDATLAVQSLCASVTDQSAADFTSVLQDVALPAEQKSDNENYLNHVPFISTDDNICVSTSLSRSLSFVLDSQEKLNHETQVDQHKSSSPNHPEEKKFSNETANLTNTITKKERYNPNETFIKKQDDKISISTSFVSLTESKSLNLSIENIFTTQMESLVSPDVSPIKPESHIPKNEESYLSSQNDMIAQESQGKGISNSYVTIRAHSTPNEKHKERRSPNHLTAFTTFPDKIITKDSGQNIEELICSPSMGKEFKDFKVNINSLSESGSEDYKESVKEAIKEKTEQLKMPEEGLDESGTSENFISEFTMGSSKESLVSIGIMVDYKERAEILNIGQNIDLGRRHSERAFEIIQENFEILNRLSQQKRRDSKVSEEGSSNDITLASENSSHLSLDISPVKDKLYTATGECLDPATTAFQSYDTGSTDNQENISQSVKPGETTTELSLISKTSEMNDPSEITSKKFSLENLLSTNVPIILANISSPVTVNQRSMTSQSINTGFCFNDGRSPKSGCISHENIPVTVINSRTPSPSRNIGNGFNDIFSLKSDEYHDISLDKAKDTHDISPPVAVNNIRMPSPLRDTDNDFNGILQQKQEQHQWFSLAKAKATDDISSQDVVSHSRTSSPSRNAVKHFNDIPSLGEHNISPTADKDELSAKEIDVFHRKKNFREISFFHEEKLNSMSDGKRYYNASSSADSKEILTIPCEVDDKKHTLSKVSPVNDTCITTILKTSKSHYDAHKDKLRDCSSDSYPDSTENEVSTHRKYSSLLSARRNDDRRSTIHTCDAVDRDALKSYNSKFSNKYDILKSKEISENAKRSNFDIYDSDLKFNIQKHKSYSDLLSPIQGEDLKPYAKSQFTYTDFVPNVDADMNKKDLKSGTVESYSYSEKASNKDYLRRETSDFSSKLQSSSSPITRPSYNDTASSNKRWSTGTYYSDFRPTTSSEHLYKQFDSSCSKTDTDDLTKYRSRVSEESWSSASDSAYKSPSRSRSKSPSSSPSRTYLSSSSHKYSSSFSATEKLSSEEENKHFSSLQSSSKTYKIDSDFHSFSSGDSKSVAAKSLLSSPTKHRDITISLPPLKSSVVTTSSHTTSKYDPFPSRSIQRQPKDLVRKLGLYPSTDLKSKYSSKKFDDK